LSLADNTADWRGKMNATQHIFICIGVVIITIMAITMDSTLLWLVAAVFLIGESVLLCKNNSTDAGKLLVLLLSIFVFVFLFLFSNVIRKELRKELGLGSSRSALSRKQIRRFGD
jgi:membrane protein implicated in regulation of membrane protease activity